MIECRGNYLAKGILIQGEVWWYVVQDIKHGTAGKIWNRRLVIWAFNPKYGNLLVTWLNTGGGAYVAWRWIFSVVCFDWECVSKIHGIVVCAPAPCMKHLINVCNLAWVIWSTLAPLYPQAALVKIWLFTGWKDVISNVSGNLVMDSKIILFC